MNLLEHLAEETGCLYLSDLHKTDIQMKLYNSLSALQPEIYTLQEWNEALTYIAGLKEPYASIDMAYQALKRYASSLAKK